MTFHAIVIFFLGFLWLLLTSVQTVFIAKGRLFLLMVTSFTLSVIWVFLVQDISGHARELWLPYSSGTALGAVAGSYLGHLASRLVKRGKPLRLGTRRTVDENDRHDDAKTSSKPD